MNESKLPSVYLLTPVAFFCGGLFLMLIGFMTFPQQYINFGSVFLFIFGMLDLVSGIILYRIEKSYWIKNNKLLIGKIEVIVGLVLGFLIIIITTFLKTLLA
jgi:hypothetical protein